IVVKRKRRPPPCSTISANFSGERVFMNSWEVKWLVDVLSRLPPPFVWRRARLSARRRQAEGGAVEPLPREHPRGRPTAHPRLRIRRRRQVRDAAARCLDRATQISPARTG